MKQYDGHASIVVADVAPRSVAERGGRGPRVKAKAHAFLGSNDGRCWLETDMCPRQVWSSWTPGWVQMWFLKDACIEQLGRW